MADNRFSVDYAKVGTSACKKCKAKITKGEIRIAKMTPSPFSEGDMMKLYHHVPCMFDTFLNARATTKVIESSTDLDGWLDISPADREIILQHIKQTQEARANKAATKSPTKKPAKSAAASESSKQTKVSPTKKTPTKFAKDDIDDEETIDYDDIEIADKKKSTDETGDITTIPTATEGVHIPSNDDPKHADNSFRQFRGLCTKIAETNGHMAKTALVQDFITYGTDGESYKGI